MSEIPSCQNNDEVGLSTVRSVAWGFVNRKARWGLSWRGKLAVVLMVTGVGLVGVFTIHSFLAVTHRENTDILVVEGWVNQHVMHVAAEEITNGSYRQAFTTGGPVEGNGGYVNDYSTAASIGAGLLRKAGVSEEMVQMVPCRVSGRDRTYSSAVALKDWFHDHKMSVRAINVLTESVHARRTRMLFQEAFGKEVTVGIISVPNPDYDAKRWWRYSEGVRSVIGETIAYIYAKFFFWPAKTSQSIAMQKTVNSLLQE